MIATLAPKTAAAPNFCTGDERPVQLTANAAKKVSTLLTRQGRANGALRVAVVGSGSLGVDPALSRPQTANGHRLPPGFFPAADLPVGVPQNASARP
jgi:hypothetical protein